MTDSSSPLAATNERQRHVIANLWHGLAQHIDRAAFFGVGDMATWRPLHLGADSETMSVGYLGSRYRPDTDPLLLGINPGGGGDAYTTRSLQDEHLYPQLMTFRGAQTAEASAAFEELQGVYPSAIRSWPLWTIIEPVLQAAGRSLDTVALMNVVPYRTRNNKPPPVNARKLGWKVLAMTLELLRPRALVVFGCEAGKVVNRFYGGDRSVYCIPRMRGDRGVSSAARGNRSSEERG